MELADYYAELYAAAGNGTPLSIKDFSWAFTPPQLTRGFAFHEIYCHETDGSYPEAAEHPWNGGTGEGLPKYYAGGAPTFSLKTVCLHRNDAIFACCVGLRELADEQIVKFAPPSVTTAYGQAKRSRVKNTGVSSASGARKKRSGAGKGTSSGSESDS